MLFMTCHCGSLPIVDCDAQSLDIDFVTVSIFSPNIKSVGNGGIYAHA